MRLRSVGLWLAGAAGAETALILAPTVLIKTLSLGRIHAPTDIPAREVGLVFGAQVYANGHPCRYLRARLNLAARLYAEGKVQTLIVSGDDRAEHHHESSSMRDYLIEAGVPAASILCDPAGLDTYDSCVRAREVYGVTSLTTISQAYHVPRTVATARLVGVDAIGVGETMINRRCRTYRQGALREVFAGLKMVWDVATRRRPPLEPQF